MRLLMITGEFPPMQGGVGDYTNEIANGMAALGHEVTVLTSRSAADASRSTRDAGRVSVLPIVGRWDWSSLRVVGRCVREIKPDIVSIQYQTGAYAMHPAIDLLPRYLTHRVITTFHDLRVPYLFPKAGPIRDAVTRELARSSDGAVATNPEDYARLAAWGIKHKALIPIGSNITTTLPAGYDRASWRARLGVEPDDLLVCHFGFVNARKGCDTLLHAIISVPRAKLLMMGGETGASDPTNVAYHAQIKSLIADLGLADRVRWTGFTPPEVVTANFRAADLCVLPYIQGASYQHGTLMAALAHGVPIITTTGSAATLPLESATALPELRDSENVLLVPPADPEALAAAIRRAAAAPELRERIGRGACALAQHFTWDKIVGQYFAFFASVV